MRRVTAGLGSLAIAAGLATTVALARGRGAAGGDHGGPAAAHVVRRAAEPGRGEAAGAAAGGDPGGPQGRGEGPAARRQQGGQGRQDATRRAGNGRRREDQYVELAREKTDKIFVVLAEFGNERAAELSGPGHGPEHSRVRPRWNGPLHNAIPAPDRTKDNSTVWQPTTTGRTTRTCTSATGEDSLKSYYERQSSGRYSVDGQVSDWVKVRYNEARYGRSNGYPCAGNVCSNTWNLIQDAINTWVDRAARRRAAPTSRSRPTSRPMTSGTATTSTTTATSTSPTGTSTTSRSSTPAATRPTATRSRARTRSGRTAGRRSRTPARARPATRTAARRSAPPACGSRTTRSSPRTAASPCSRTSTATTSACRTTTTPPAARTTPSTGGR